MGEGPRFPSLPGVRFVRKQLPPKQPWTSEDVRDNEKGEIQMENLTERNAGMIDRCTAGNGVLDVPEKQRLDAETCETAFRRPGIVRQQ